jgi:nickel/cobalt exporter
VLESLLLRNKGLGGIVLTLGNFQDLVQQGSLHAWLYIPTAILLGALHGLEPGHSKTMMAAFIIAVRGTVLQAALLGLCAAFSHSLVIWLLAGVALHYGSQFNVASTEPYFQLGSAVMIFGLAAWMAWRTARDIKAEADHHNDQNHDHAHDHDHADEGKVIETGDCSVKVEIFEKDVPPKFRLSFSKGEAPEKLPNAGSVSVETVRPDGTVQAFAFAARGAYLESTTSIPEPHEFTATLRLSHGDHSHGYPLEFLERHGHSHGGSGAGFQDAHELAHATEIERRFAGRTVTTGQIALFGLTGGLLPCPAAFTIVLVCLQLKRFALGIFMVAAFSAGLAFTLVVAGVVAAWSLRHAQKRFSGLGTMARKLPYLSSGILALMALYIGFQGWWHLSKHFYGRGVAFRDNPPKEARTFMQGLTMTPLLRFGGELSSERKAASRYANKEIR